MKSKGHHFLLCSLKNMKDHYFINIFFCVFFFALVRGFIYISNQLKRNNLISSICDKNRKPAMEVFSFSFSFFNYSSCVHRTNPCSIYPPAEIHFPCYSVCCDEPSLWLLLRCSHGI